jgi:DNA-binding NtrC family response regulator
MIHSGERKGVYDFVEAPAEQEGARNRVTSGRVPAERPSWNLPHCLVLSSDEGIRQQLLKSLRSSGFAPVFVSTVEETRMALLSIEVCIAVCDESAIDGNVQAIVELVGDIDSRIPVIVISRTGEWPEYFAAIRAGAFDYVGFPPIPGEFHRILRNVLQEREYRQHFVRIRVPHPDYELEEQI